MKSFLIFLMMMVIRLGFGHSTQQEALTHYLSALVAMPTETSQKHQNDKALHWVKQQLAPLGLHFKHHIYQGHPTLIVTTKETMTPDIFLVAHIDVVPASEALFKPKIIGSKMYGRGAYDMKMAIACYLLLLHELADQHADLNIGLMLTSDEEVGGMNGVKRLLDAGYCSKVAFLPDGGFDWNFEEEAKGVLQIKLTARGQSSHSSRPEKGDNAITALTTLLGKISHYFEEQKKQFGSYYPTDNVGVIQGGEAINQVPERAEATMDIRYPPSVNRDQLYADIREIVHKDSRLSIEITAEGSPHQVDVSQAPFARFREIAEKRYGIKVGKTRSYGASDARFFGERGIPVLVIAPKGGEIHSDGEWIDLEDLTRFYYVLKQWVLESSPI